MEPYESLYYKILENENLADGERETRARAQRERINKAEMQIISAAGDYRAKYSSSTDFVKNLMGGVVEPVAENFIPGPNKPKKK